MRYFFLKTLEQKSFKKRSILYNSKKKLNFGNYGLFFNKTTRFEFVYFFFLKKLVKNMNKNKYNLKSFFKIWIFLNSNFPISKKSKNARMGKGKGIFLRWAIFIPYNNIFIEFILFNFYYFILLFKKFKRLMPNKIFYINKN